jgi:Flp pilus assembly protein TadG
MTNSNLGGRLRKLAATLRRLPSRLAKDSSGAAAIFFAVCMLLLAPLTLGLVSIYMSNSERTHLQDALDAAALYVARTKLTDPEEIAAVGKQVLMANLGLLTRDQQTKLVNSSFVLTDENKVVASAQMIPPDLGPVVFTQGNLQAHSEVTRNSNNLEVALVLDITGSMSDDMADLKIAAKDLVDLVVQDDQDPYYSRLGIVPYDEAVNVGALAPTVRGTPANSITFRKPNNKSVTVNLTTCISERQSPASQAYTDTFPNKTASTNLLGPVYGDCLSSKIVPLTSDKGTLKSAINNLNGGGSTAGHIGLAWGWYLIAPNFKSLWTSSKIAPYPTKPEDELIKVVIMMTDGEFNTQYCSSGAPDANSTSVTNRNKSCTSNNGASINQAKALCESIKAKGVVLYTVGYDLSKGSSFMKMLEACATDKDHFKQPATGEELKKDFAAIGAEISQLRISK